MEKLKLNVPLLHKAESLVPTEVIVEKVVRLPRHFFAGLCEHPQNDNPIYRLRLLLHIDISHKVCYN